MPATSQTAHGCQKRTQTQTKTWIASGKFSEKCHARTTLSGNLWAQFFTASHAIWNRPLYDFRGKTLSTRLQIPVEVCKLQSQ
eukprot:6217816-Amphidinium_carterae.1